MATCGGYVDKHLDLLSMITHDMFKQELRTRIFYYVAVPN